MPRDRFRLLTLLTISTLTLVGCTAPDSGGQAAVAQEQAAPAASEEPEYFLLRPEVEKAFGYRGEIYTTHFPTGTWLEVKGLALPGFMIEIELEAHRAD